MVSVRYPSVLDRWFESCPSESCPSAEDDYADGRWSGRIVRAPSRPRSRDGHVAASEALALDGRPDDDEAPTDPVLRLAARPFQWLNLFVHDAAEAYRVLGRVRHVLRYRPVSARPRQARPLQPRPLQARPLQARLQQARAERADGGPPVAASFDEYRDRVAKRHRDVRDIRSAFGMAVKRPCVAGGELI